MVRMAPLTFKEKCNRERSASDRRDVIRFILRCGAMVPLTSTRFY